MMDAYNFYPAKLDDAGKTFGADVRKSTFPYEYYTDLESMKNATAWPDYSAFKSTLRPFVIPDPEKKLKDAMKKAIEQHGFTASEMIEAFNLHEYCSDLRVVDEFKCPEFCLQDQTPFTLDPELYLDSKAMFEKLKSQNELSNIHQYLLIYNIHDTIVGLQAFERMNIIFDEQFGISLLNNFSIPSVSLKILWKFYDRERNSPYSFGPKYPHLPAMIRDKCYGGLSGPIQLRHAEANGDEDKYPSYVTHAPNGKKYQLIVVKDVTSLYG